MAPQKYGWQHLTYIAVMIVVTVVSLILTKKYAKSEKTKTIVVKCYATLLLVAVIVNRWSVVFKTNPPEWNWLLPDSLCGLNSFVLSLGVLCGKKDNSVIHFAWLAGLCGGIIVTFYPDFIGQNPSFMYLPTISGLLHHTLSVVVAISLFVFGYIRISYKKWYCPFWGFICYLAAGAFFITVMGYGDAYHMVNPVLSGTPFTIWFIAPIFIALHLAITFTVELIRKKKNKQQSVLSQ